MRNASQRFYKQLVHRLFRFPTNAVIKEKWIRVLNRPHWTPQKTSTVCSKHFDEKYFVQRNTRRILMKHAVPTKFVAVTLKPRRPVSNYVFRDISPVPSSPQAPQPSPRMTNLIETCYKLKKVLKDKTRKIRNLRAQNKRLHEKIFSSTVVKCEPTKEPIVDYGKTSEFEGYQVTLENTILFPAGGGQPHDVGWLNNTEVLQVVRKGDEAVHFTKDPLEVGTVVEQKINWERRFDHMQQHSGQHLLSAILEKEHNVPTTSWWLGADESYVELDANKVTDEIIRTTEERCNQLIREALRVDVKFCKANDPQLDEAQTRGLPKDCMDTIRIICIGELDKNMCCGTHVSNLSQLQMIKLIGADPGKKGKVNLKFLVGGRVLKTLQIMLDREKALTGLLKNEPNKHEELVQKLQKNMKDTNKNLRNVILELAQFEVDKIKSMVPKPKYVFMFKKEGTPEFNRAIVKGLEGEGLFMFLASEEPDKPKEGQIIIQGPEEHCNALGKKITELLKGKGAFKNGRFQGKAGDMGGINKCKKIIEEYFSSLS